MSEPDSQPPVDITDERVGRVMQMVRKHANASAGGAPHIFFRLYPPQSYLDAGLPEAGIYEKYRGTIWTMVWWDKTVDELTFMELLAFLDMLFKGRLAMEQASRVVSGVDRHRGSKHAGGWTPPKDRTKKRKPPQDVRVNITGIRLEPVKLQRDDAMIRAMIGKTVIERNTRATGA